MAKKIKDVTPKKEKGPIVIRPKTVGTKIEDIHNHIHNISRGTGVTNSKKKQSKEFRKAKHKQSTRDLY